MKKKETDLYFPLKNYLEKRGYTVYGEVKNCDVAAIKDKELVIIEMKRSVSLKLVIQGTDRQKINKAVYLAYDGRGKSFTRGGKRELLHLLKRLGLGLIAIYPNKKEGEIEIILNPKDPPTTLQVNRKRRKELLTEIGGRYRDFNTGGSASSVETLTSYRLKALKIITLLEKKGQSSPADLVKSGGPENTGDILRKNYYGWFEKVKKGTYTLSEKGLSALDKYPVQIAYFRQII